MTREQFRVWIAPVSQTVAVLVVFGTGIAWWLNLQAKVEGLERQVGELKTAIANQSPASSSTNACQSLSEQYAAALARGTKTSDNAAVSLRALMTDIGCMLMQQKQK